MPEPSDAPLVVREPLIIRRNVGKAQIDIERLGDPSGPIDESSWEWFIETGYYDGYPADVYQTLFFYPSDYTSDGVDPDTVNRWIKLLDFSREFRARPFGSPAGSGGDVLFYSAGYRPNIVNLATDPTAVLVERWPISAVRDWTQLHPLARYVAFAPADDTADACVFEARG
jgi:hypothetical protein